MVSVSVNGKPVEDLSEEELDAAIETLYDEVAKHRRNIELLKRMKEDIKRTNRNQLAKVRGEVNHSHDRLGRFVKIHRDDAEIRDVLEGGAIDCFGKGLTHRRMAERLAPSPDEVNRIYERIRKRVQGSGY
jgi:hypothetical protein